MKNKIKILVVDDSIFFRQIIINGLKKNDHFEIVGYAVDGEDAKEKLLSLKPDVITLDVEMPGTSGLDFLKQTMDTHLVPVILVSSLNISVFEALSYGAVDFVKKPNASEGSTLESFISSLTNKIVIASYAQLNKIPRPSSISPKLNPSILVQNPNPAKWKSGILAIGASTGGTEVIFNIVKDLPIDFPPIVVVQHMPEGFTKMYAERINKMCQMNVKEGQDGDILEPGNIYIAPGNFQMEVIPSIDKLRLKCYMGEKVSGHRPSVDTLFASVSKLKNLTKVGVILTGMGKDGASGLFDMRSSGALTLGQNKETCTVYGMPMVAFNIGAVMKQLPFQNMETEIRDYFLKK